MQETDPRIRNSPIYWFVILESARERSEFGRAKKAQDELRRLGIRVTYRRSKTPNKGGRRAS